MDWHRVDVAYHEDRCDDLLLDAIRPLFDEIGGRRYFTRHWQRGPHLRLCFHCSEAAFGTVWQHASRTVGGHVRRNPSKAVLDEQRLLALHQNLARAERVTGPLTPFYPNNSLHRALDPSRADVLGSAEADELIRDFYTETGAATFGMLAEIRAGRSRLGLAFELMVATSQVFARGGISAGFVSFRSHAEAFLAQVEGRDRLRAAWDGQYETRSAQLRERLRAVVEAADGRSAAVPEVTTWVATLSRFRDRGSELVGDGSLAFESLRPGAGTTLPHSEFHRALGDNEQWFREVEPAGWFRVYRLLLNLTYLQLSRLGINAVERFLVCHLVAGAVESEYEVSAIDAIRA